MTNLDPTQVIFKLERFNKEERRMVVEEQNFPTTMQLAHLAEHGGTVVEHRMLAREGDESIRKWMLVQPNGHGSPIWVKPDGSTEDVKGLPYPWCMGNPTKAHCVANGYCRRAPNCGD